VALDDDDNDFLAKRPVRKTNKPIDGNDIFADVTIKGQQTNKAKKDWAIMDKSKGSLKFVLVRLVSFLLLDLHPPVPNQKRRRARKVNRAKISTISSMIH
jgi:hypothetical protein